MEKQKRGIRLIAIGLFFITVIIAVTFGICISSIYKNINFELDESLFENSRRFESTVFYADGSESEDYSPVAIELSGNMRKLHYGLEEISPYVKRGVVAVEDKIFYEHSGIDIKRTALAAINYLTKRQKTFGASTITQQVIKNISGDNELSLKRKISEIIRALHIERNYSKEYILEVYLNVIPMGDSIYGVGAASRAYFGKEPSELSVEEAAALIGITNAPTAYSPYRNPDACMKKRNVILGVMLDDGIINDEEYSVAVNSELNVIPREEREDRFDSWFVETAIDEICVDLANKYGVTPSSARMMLLQGGYKVYTTMNPQIQTIMENYFENTDNLANEVENGLNYAMVVTDPQSGNLLGIIGRAGNKQGNRLLNHATVPHTPASTLKPIALYAPLIDEGIINWATVFDDVPVSFNERDGEYTEYPRNSPNVYDGLITVKDAVRLSKNTVAVRLCNLRGPKTVYRSLIDDFKFNTLVDTDANIAPMALGQLGKGISLLRLAEAYSVFPGEGVRRDVRSYLFVYDHNGKMILNNEEEGARIFKESTARIMNRLLMNVVESGTAASITLKNKVEIAGKTGTSGENRDKLFIGYTPRYLAGIWCGYDNSSSISSMSKGHLQIWDEVMTEIYGDATERESFSTEGLLYLPYCKDSGKEYSENCIYDPRGDRQEYGYFTAENKPNGECDRHVLCYYDSETKAIASQGCPMESLLVVSLIAVKERAFPKEIIVTDAEFVYRDITRHDIRPIDYALPYFEYTIPDGVFVGRSKGKKQFNSNCYIHDD